MISRKLIEDALTPRGPQGPQVSLRRGEVVAPGMVSTEPDDLTGSPVDGPAIDGSGAVLSIDGHRVFIPYTPSVPQELAERVEQAVQQATTAQESVNSTHEEAVQEVARLEQELAAAVEDLEQAQQQIDALTGDVTAAQEAVADLIAAQQAAADTIADLIARIEALEGSGPSNLLTQTDPDLEANGDAAFVIWGSTLPAGYRLGHTYGEPAGPQGLTFLSLNVSDNDRWGLQAPLDFVPSGVGAVPVAAGTAYRADCWIRTDGSGTDQARMGICWYDSAGLEVSVQWGDWVPTEAGTKPWADEHGLWSGGKEANPAVVAAVAPTGAVFGQPRVEVDIPTRTYYWAAHPWMSRD